LIAYSLPVIFQRAVVVGARLVVAAGVLVAGLCGCEGQVSHPTVVGEETSALPAVPSASAPSRASVSPAPPATSVSGGSPTVPSAAGGSGVAAPSGPSPSTSAEMAAGIESAVYAFYDAINVSSATSDPSAYEAVTTPGCPCRAFVDGIESLQRDGQHWVGGGMTVTKVRVHDLVGGGGSAEVWYDVSPGTLVDAASNPIATATDAPRGHADMFVVYSNGRWLVADNVFLS